MKVQTLSIVVPTKGCVNNCKFCVSRMHDTHKKIEYLDPYLYKESTKKRLKYAKDLGVNTIIYTGTGEALQNKLYLSIVSDIQEQLNYPFPNVELQTTGVLLLENIEFIKAIGINTISLSVSDLFDESRNNNIIGTSEKNKINLLETCLTLKEHNINIRLSINLIGQYNDPQTYFDKAKELGASQITFRKMYTSSNNNEIDKWIDVNKSSELQYNDLIKYITKTEDNIPRSPLYKLPFGAEVFSINGISTVIDTNCMAKTESNSDLETFKYFILRENAKLYCRWDDEGSLIF